MHTALRPWQATSCMPACVRSHFRMSNYATRWTVACQVPLSTGFSRHIYWNGLPCPTPGDLPDPGTEPSSLIFLALEGGFFITGTTWEALRYVILPSICPCHSLCLEYPVLANSILPFKIQARKFSFYEALLNVSFSRIRYHGFKKKNLIYIPNSWHTIGIQ